MSLIICKIIKVYGEGMIYKIVDLLYFLFINWVKGLKFVEIRFLEFKRFDVLFYLVFFCCILKWFVFLFLCCLL